MKLINYIFILINAFVLYSCANVKTPTGGPIDKEPPKLIFVKPDTNETDYKLNSIELVFNKIVEISNEKDINIQPEVKEYETNFKGKKIILNFKEPLKDNTTYTVNFGKTINDITERNIAEDIFVSFSTGEKISTGYIDGNVTDHISDIKRENITVGLYLISDSIIKQTPIYSAKTDKNGKYKIRNINEGEYKLIAFDDKNSNKKLDEDKEKFGFIGSKLSINNDSLTYNLKLINKKPKLKIDDIKKYNLSTKITFTTGIYKYELNGKYEYSYLNNSRTVNIYHTNDKDENLKIQITDSLNNKIDTIITVLPKTSVKKEKTGKNKIIKYYKSDSYNKIEFEKPILSVKNIRLLKINLKLDTLSSDSLKNKKYIKDTVVTIITPEFEKNCFKFSTKDTSVNIVIYSKEIIFYDSTTTDTINLDLKSFKEIEYSSLDGLIKDTLNKSNYIVQLLKDSSVKAEYVSSDNKFRFDKIEIGNYNLRVISDINKNNVFDYSDLMNNILAEPVYNYPNNLTIKKNWDIKDLIININTVNK